MKHRATLKAISILLIIFTICSATSVFAAPPVDGEQITCNACMLIDASTGTVIYANENVSTQIAPASTTKILTAIVVLERCNLTDMVTVGEEINVIGSKTGLIEGETISVKDLLYGMMLKSGNDAAVALAFHVAGSMEEFAKIMNEKAAEIGMANSNFVNAAGLDNEDHYVTVEDMAKLALYAMKNETLREIAGTASYTLAETNMHSQTIIFNTNKLLCKEDGDTSNFTYTYATGFKTGSTLKAGGCVVATAAKDGMELLALVYGDFSEDENARWNLAKYLFEYGFNHFTTKNVFELANGVTVTATVNNAFLSDGSKGIKQIPCSAQIEENTKITVDKSLLEGQELSFEFIPNGVLEAPVFEGDIIGKVALKYGASTIYEADAVAGADALDTESAKSSTVSLMEYLKMDEDSEADPDAIKSSLWLWMALPIAAAVVLVLLMVLKNRKKRANLPPSSRGPAIKNNAIKTRASRSFAKRPSRLSRRRRRRY